MKKHTVGYIRQLCSLGLGGQVIMPELLHALHAFIPSSFNLYSWADENCQFSNAYSENDELTAALPIYFQEFYNSKEAAALGSTFSNAMRLNGGWRNTARLGQRFFTSELFNEFCRPIKIQHGLQTTIWDAGRSLGSLSLYRSPGERAFTHDDENTLRSLMPYIAHGVRGTRDLRGEFTQSGESGTVIVDAEDKVVSYCPEGRRLLLLATHSAYGPGQYADLRSPLIQNLCANLRGLLTGKPRPPPILIRQNAWGKFSLRAYPLDGEPMAGSIVVLIERLVPLTIKLVRNMESTGMTARQREVCLLLSYGYSHSRIAERMGVSKHTATDYVRKIYDKLDVGGYPELMQKLSSEMGVEGNIRS